MNVGTPHRRALVAPAWAVAVLAASVTPAAAHANKFKVDIEFGACETGPPCEPGGRAVGYFVLTDDLTAILDWAIAVSGGDETVFEPFLYDPTTSTARAFRGFQDIPFHLVFSVSGGERRLEFYPTAVLVLGELWLFDWRNAELQPEVNGRREIVAGSRLVTDFAPTVALKVNGLHPGTRLVNTTGPVQLTLDVVPSSRTGPFDWYWTLVIDGTIYWVTASGLSTVPAPLGTFTPPLLNNSVLLEINLAAGTQLTAGVFLVEGSTVISADWITAYAGF